MSGLKYLIGGAGVVGVILGTRYFIRLHRLSNKSVVEFRGRVHKLDFKGLDIALEYNIKNPTSKEVRMSVPLISLSYKGSVIASSAMDATEIPETSKDKDGRIVIAIHKETGFISTHVLIPLLSIPTVAKDLIVKLNAPEREKLKFSITTTATIYTDGKEFPYDDTQIIKI